MAGKIWFRLELDLFSPLVFINSLKEIMANTCHINQSLKWYISYFVSLKVQTTKSMIHSSVISLLRVKQNCSIGNRKQIFNILSEVLFVFSVMCQWCEVIILMVFVDVCRNPPAQEYTVTCNIQTWCVIWDCLNQTKRAWWVKMFTS